MRFVRGGAPAGVVLFGRNIASTEQVASLVRELRALWPADGPAPLIAVDQEGGRVRRLRAPECPDVAALPDARTLGEADDVATTHEAGRITGAQLAALGFNVDFAPVLDVDSNPANPIIGRRAFATDAQAAARHGVAWLQGLEQAEVTGCGKHFPGHGDTSVDSHLALPRLDLDLARLAAVELVPFAAAIAAGARLLMTAHVVFTPLDAHRPATLSPHVIPRLLRERLGYTGALVTDDLEMGAVAALPPEEVAAGALSATCDLLLVCRDLDRAAALRDALAHADGEARAAAARRVATLRASVGDHAARPAPPELPAQADATRLLARLGGAGSEPVSRG